MPCPSTLFDIPEYAYFHSGNRYTGSLGTFRYLLKPEDESLHTYSYSDIAFELAEIYAQNTFPLTPEGLTEAIQWIEQEYRENRRD